MRNLNELNKYRRTDQYVIKHYGTAGDSFCGVFSIPSPVNKRTMMCIASTGQGWDHVSVSKERKTPSWIEMDYVKRLFFKDDEVAMQLHVTPEDHINIHSHCLHLWRPTDREIPLPPKVFV